MHQDASARRAWWRDWLGAEPDPRGWVEPAGSRRLGSTDAEVLRLHSFGDGLDCLLARPAAPAPHPVVIIPFYEVEPLFGLPGRRTSAGSSRAFGTALLEHGLAVAAAPWWFESVVPDDAPAGLAERYGPPAARHAARLPTTGLGRSVGDLRLLLDHLSRTPGIRTDRIGVFGHSLGGKLALHLAALDERIAAAVAHEPGLGLDHSNWDAPWYLGDRRPPDRDHDQLLGLVAPRPFLLAGGGDSDGDHNAHLVRSARTAWPDNGLTTLCHDRGHPPPPHVITACAHWLATHLG